MTEEAQAEANYTLPVKQQEAISSALATANIAFARDEMRAKGRIAGEAAREAIDGLTRDGTDSMHPELLSATLQLTMHRTWNDLTTKEHLKTMFSIDDDDE